MARSKSRIAGTDPNDFSQSVKPRKAPLWTKLLVAVGALMLLVSTGAYASAKYVGNTVEGSVQRGDFLDPSISREEAEERFENVKGPLTFLVLGSDSRKGENLQEKDNFGNVETGERTDTIMVVHVPATMDRAYVVSIPRDSYVNIASRKGSGMAGKARVNAAFDPGGNEGVQRMVRTISHLTGIEIDIPVVVEFSAVRKITDLVGGVTVTIDKDSHDGYRFMQDNKYPTVPCRDEQRNQHNCLAWKAGTHTLNGELAEYYVRQRKGLADGDFDRAKRQQQFMKALMGKVASGGTLSNPRKLKDLVTAGASSVRVDQSVNVMNLAFALKGIGSSDIAFISLPMGEPRGGTVDGQEVLFPDLAKTKKLFSAMTSGTMEQWIVQNGTNDVSHGV